MGKFARGKGARSYEARFSPSRSPFPGTSLFCAVVWGSVLANACMLLYWWHQAEPIFFRRTEGGLRSRPVPGGCCIAGANLLLPVVLLLALISAPACCIAGADLLLPAILLVLTCSRLLSHHWHRPTSACRCIDGAHLLPSVVVLPTLTCFRLLSHHWHRPAPINNREQARCAGRFPVRRNKNRLSLTLPIQQHTGLSR